MNIVPAAEELNSRLGLFSAVLKRLRVEIACRLPDAWLVPGQASKPMLSEVVAQRRPYPAVVAILFPGTQN
jgi:hypothetical protein